MNNQQEKEVEMKKLETLPLEINELFNWIKTCPMDQIHTDLWNEKCRAYREKKAELVQLQIQYGHL